MALDVPLTLVRGDVDEGYGPVAEAFRRNFAERGEIGAACAVYRDGRKVVDLWGGYRDGTTRSPWREDTVVVMYSTTKGVSSLALALAHSRGLLDYDERVCTYWPEFAWRGKENITVRQLLAHQAGLPVIDIPLCVADLADLDVVAAAIALQRPMWTPGTRHGYIAVDPATDPAPFRAFALSGNRLVIDVAHAGQSPWYCGQVHFGDQEKITAGIDPPVTAVERRLTKPAVAGAALQELFNGPNEAERDRGLIFVSSHATGFTDLRISEWKVAHVRLLGPISSDGSAVITIATQIIPTLKQFPTVDWVKIYDEDGKTQQPDGPVDSVPEQLEP